MTERVRETQAQRRARMRTRLLDAAIESLVEVGYAGTTTLEVQNRAGVPRGTLQHHFPTKPDLLAGAVEHLAARRLAQLTTEFAAIPEDVDRLATAVELTMRMFSGSSFLAALEIWVGARTDAELRAAFLPLEQRLFELMHTSIRDIFRAEFPDDPRVPTITEFTIEIMTGLAMRALLTGNVERNRILQQRWTNAVRVLLGTAPPGTLLDPRPV
ncbi:transcriptional regulator, TetR family [Nocardia amikacinitolerans]|uniref:Transcriptional regulator, TetR family n=1 Tax=Nocardia amikacinitolerans TaxID=756689 RepID=A0A285LWB2_9NOCA|nr:TetR/AcrR family transcriptional regulator [Nocardia amikacinitolerans]MCP2276415.1 transcriptional regulator, TetR family [Nocardia amikacinitolerans]MCP2295205.1 transcriptional regulator, TetR family [Nocardia amikacinitolerans]SNY87631.1 transcriptional regulator, TetR family [Nocardia amikacinitolerans]